MIAPDTQEEWQAIFDAYFPRHYTSESGPANSAGVLVTNDAGEQFTGWDVLVDGWEDGHPQVLICDIWGSVRFRTEGDTLEVRDEGHVLALHSVSGHTYVLSSRISDRDRAYIDALNAEAEARPHV